MTSGRFLARIALSPPIGAAMKSLCLIALLTLASQSALADGKKESVADNSALAFAALVAENSSLPAQDKAILAAFLAGNAHVSLGATQKITVTADRIVCKASNVDLTYHSCTLTFGKKNVSLSGRKAHELYATMIELGVQTEGAAGSIYAGLSQLACTIDAKEIESADGGGATCSYAPQ
jgi:hypothetical protein